MKKQNFWKELIAWENSKVKKMDVWDIMFIKISVIGFTLMIAKLSEPILSLDWYWYAIIFVVAVIKPIKKMFS